METTNKTYVGVDVGSQDLIVSEGLSESTDKFRKLATKQILNDSASINSWLTELPADSHVIFEVTGTYSLKLAYCLQIAEIAFTILTPSQSKGLAQTLKVTNQNDEIDASLLAIYGANYQPLATQLESETLHQLKQKRKHLASLMHQKQIIDNQLHALSFDSKADTKVQDSLALLQVTFELQIQQFTDELFTLTTDQYQHIYDLMVSVVGIGKASANAIIIATNGLENFDSAKAVVKFLGLAPQQKESGKSIRNKYGINKSGVAFVRATLYSAARSAKRYNLACKELYERLRNKGKCHKVAMIAVINKMIRQVFAVVKSNTIFDNQFQVAK